MSAPRSNRLGAYGFALEGLPDARDLLVEAPPAWPTLTVLRAPGGERPEVETVTDDHAQLWLASGASAELDRRAGRAEMHVPEGTSDAALVHPYLAPVALIMARWLGREGMHGGAVVVGDGAWAVLGDKTAGKSTALAALALRGVPVVSDDVLVIDDGNVLAGPRSLDLREEAARRLGVGESMGRVGARERWRHRLGPVAPELPLRGWITLEWGDEIAVEPLAGAARLAALLPHRGVRLAPTIPHALLRLSRLPHLRLVRPRRFELLDEVTTRLLGALAG